jgi:hypothetical protein
MSRALVAHACNPNYSGGKDQEDGGLKQAQANGSTRPYLKNPSQKRADGVAQVPISGKKKKTLSHGRFGKFT